MSTQHSSRPDQPTAMFPNTGHLIKGANRTPPEITARPALLDVAMATDFMSRNTEPREINKRNLAGMESDIRNDRWDENGASVVISDTGELNDGQHRCQAVINTGIPIMVILVEGPKRQTRFSTDTGDTKKLQHLLAMNSVPHPKCVARVSKLIFQIEKRGVLTSTRSGGVSSGESMPELLEYAHFRMTQIQRSIVAVSEKSARSISSFPNVVAAHLFLTEMVGDRAEVNEFFHGLCTGANLDLGGPIMRTRDRLQNERLGVHGCGVHRVFEIIIRGWNKHRRGRSGKLLIMGFWPEIER